MADCIPEIIAASGDVLTKREAAELLRKFNESTNRIPIEQRTAALEDMLRQMGENMVRRNEAFSVQAKFVELLQQSKLNNTLSKVQNEIGQVDSKLDKVSGFSHKVKTGLETVLYGRPGKRDGLVNHFEGVRTRFNVALMAPLQEKGLLGHWGDTPTLRSAVEVAFNPSSTAVSKEAQEIGAVLRDVWKLSVGRLNKAGAYVQPTARVLFNAKVADPSKIRAVGLDGFLDFVRGLDLDQKFFQGMEDADIDEYLTKLYERLAGGDQFRAPTGTFDGIGGLTKERYRNLASSNSIDYDLPFANAQAYFQFADAFSDEPLQAVISRRVDQIGRAVGLMEAFGPAPERFLDDLLAKLEPSMTADDRTFLLQRPNFDPAPQSRGQAALGIFQTPFKLLQRFYLDAHPKDALKYMTGETSAVVDATGARMAAGLRSWATMASLGNGLFMQLTDMPLKISQLLRYGKDPFGTIVGTLTDFANSFPSEERQLFYSRLGVSAEIMMRNMAHATAGEGGQGMSRAMDWYFKLNGMAWKDRVAKQHTADLMSNSLAWALNNPNGKQTLELFRSYGFNDADFAKMKGAISSVDGIEVVDPKVLEQIDDRLYERYLGAMNDIINNATPTPGVREKAVSLKGTKRGTWEGEALSIAMMFKNYPAMLLTRVYPNIHYEHGVGGTMTTMLSMFMMWYIGDSMKQLSQGKSPKDMTKAENVAEGMIKSGFGGIYSDMVTNDYRRNGMGIADVIGGPVAGRINDVLELGSAAGRFKQDAETGEWKSELTGKMVTQKALRAIPNVHIGKTVLEHSLLYGIMEMSDPGSVDQAYQRLKERTGQERLF